LAGGVSFRRALALIVLGGLVLRVLYAYVLVGDDPLLGDALEFHLQANALADGHGYLQPFLFHDQGIVRPSADKPPLYPLLEAAISLLGGRTWAWHHVVGMLCGAATVAVIGLLGRRVGGPRVGLLAAGIAALYPLLIATDGSLRSETLYALLIAAVLLAALRLRERPDARRAAEFGVLVALATLTRGEALLLLGLLALVAVPLRGAGIAVAACVLVLAPWLARCWIVFDQPVLISTNVGGLLAGANCDSTYHGAFLGQWDLRCIPPPRFTNEAREASHLRGVGLDYARDHAGRVPVVVAARLGRSFELFRVRQQATMEAFYEGRHLRVEQAGVAMYYVLLALGAVGIAVLRRRRGPWAVLVAPFAAVVVVSVTAYGFTRFRVAAEPGLVVLAAVGLAALIDRARERARRDDGDEREGGHLPAPVDRRADGPDRRGGEQAAGQGRVAARGPDPRPAGGRDD
jgi:4-amino-4-deoxy-L-arabinose transferase-like glycosyltransferase